MRVIGIYNMPVRRTQNVTYANLTPTVRSSRVDAFHIGSTFRLEFHMCREQARVAWYVMWLVM